MDPLGVVPDQPIHEFGIELIKNKQQTLMIIQELLLNRAIEPLDVGIHLRGFRVSVVVSDLQFEHFGGEVLFPLAAVVGQDKGDRMSRLLRHATSWPRQRQNGQTGLRR